MYSVKYMTKGTCARFHAFSLARIPQGPMSRLARAKKPVGRRIGGIRHRFAPEVKRHVLTLAGSGV